MPNFIFEPTVSEWQKRTDPFIVTATAYDDSGNLLINKTASIQYKLAYSGQNPDKYQMYRVYSDVNGIMRFLIDKPCLATVYALTHDSISTDVFITKDTIVEDYSITFQPTILNITVKYNGPAVQIYSDYNPIYLNIVADMSDGTTQVILIDDIILNSLTIYKLGDNEFYFTYIEQLLNKDYTIYFIVPGTEKCLSLKASYAGLDKLIGSMVEKFELLVEVEKLKEVGQPTEWVTLTDDEWSWVSIPIITETNQGLFVISYNGLTTTVKIPMIPLGNFKLWVWYEGPEIQIGESYNPENVVVLIETKDGDKIRLYKWATDAAFRTVDFNSYLVTKEGPNMFILTYRNSGKVYKHAFPVIGIKPKQYVDLDFKVLYIKSAVEQYDYTEHFTNFMQFDKTLYVSWNSFLNAALLLKENAFGLFRVVVPPRCGLSKTYTTEWNVKVYNRKDIKASLVKLHHEDEEQEEKENGQKEEG